MRDKNAPCSDDSLELKEKLIRCKDCRNTFTFCDGRTVCTLVPEWTPMYKENGYCHRAERKPE